MLEVAKAVHAQHRIRSGYEEDGGVDEVAVLGIQGVGDGALRESVCVSGCV